MTMTDPVADLLTRIRNSVAIRRKSVDVPASKLKVAIVDVLQREGYVESYEVSSDALRPVITLKLRYDDDGMSAIQTIDRQSKPGRRQYRNSKELPSVMGGLGIAVLSTSKGVLSDREARKERVGGEFLCSVS